MILTTYTVVTPCGGFTANWDEDEAIPVQYEGEPDAIACFKAFLDLGAVSGRDGALLQFDGIEPADLYGFCQSEKYGITVLPTADDLIDEIEEQKETNMQVITDSVDNAQAFTLIGEGAQLLNTLDENSDSFFADLGRLREIIQALGDDAQPVVEPTDGKTPDETAPVVPDPVVPNTTPSDATMQSYIAIAADSIESLRRIDVYRVLNAVAADNIDGVTRGALATWIVANRPDLRDEVTAVMAEEFPGEGWTGAASTDETPPVVEPTVEPVVEPEPPVVADNPQRTNDLTFFADVAAGKVDMWADNLADKLEEMIAGYSDDSEVTAAWTEAVNAYTNFMVNAMKDA